MPGRNPLGRLISVGLVKDQALRGTSSPRGTTTPFGRGLSLGRTHSCAVAVADATAG
jgi:hypothetical protein